MAGVDLLNQIGKTAGWDDNANAEETVTLNVREGASSNLFTSVNNNFPQDEDPDSYMKAYERIKDDISLVEKNAEEINAMSNQYRMSDAPKEDKKIMENLDEIMANNTKLIRQIKGDLEQAKKDNDIFEKKSDKGSSVVQWRKNQLNTVTKRFKVASFEFQKTLNAFNATLKNKQTRHIRIVNTDGQLSQQEIDEIASDPEQAAKFIQKQFQLQDISDAMMDRLTQIEQRHEGMLRIEKSIKELQEMWTELHILVTEQQELLDNISKNVEMTKDYVKSGTKNLIQGEKHQKLARKQQLCIMICCCIALVILLAVLFGTNIFKVK